MKKTWISLIGCFLFSQWSFAATGAFFSLTSSGSSITIRTTVPNHTYPNAGIKVNSTGYTLNTSGCTPNSNGYCLFSVSNTSPKTLTISGPTTKKLDIILCLNGKGPLTCQEYTIGENFAYVVNAGSDSVSLCGVNSSTGQFSNCQSAGATGLVDPFHIALNATGTFAYITNRNGNSVSQCTINPVTKLFTSCSATALSANTPDGIVLNRANTLAYISFTSSQVQYCQINSGTGALSACTNAVTDGSQNFGTATGMTLNSANTFAYVTGDQGYVSSCAVNASTGTLSNCKANNITSLTNAQSVTLNDAGTLAYLFQNNGVIFTCGASPNTGTLTSACNMQTVVTGNGASGALTLNFFENRAYIVPNNGNAVTVCPVNTATGLLIGSGCVDSGVGGVFSDPVDIAFLR